MKSLFAILLSVFLTVSASFAQITHNNLIGDIPIALVVNSANQGPSVASTLNEWYLRNSYGQANLQFSIFSMPFSPSSAGCDIYAVADLMKPWIADHPGFYSYMFADNSCGIVGFGWPYAPTPMGWIGSTDPFWIGHEMAHTFGITHYHSIDCFDYYISPNCTISEGSQISGDIDFSAGTKHGLGWIEPLTVEGDSIVELTPLESPGGLKAVRFPFSHPAWGERFDYLVPYESYIYLSYRAELYHAVIADAVLVSPPPPYTWTHYDSFLLKAVDSDCFVGNDGSVSVRVLQMDETKAVVSISFGPCETAPPPCTPSTETRTRACPRGCRGKITEERTSTCPGPVYGDWVEVSNTCERKGKKGGACL